MHTPSTEPRRSIYYDYKVYPFVRPPEMDGKKRRWPVIVVGAGPVGLVTALDLARHGVASILLESEQQVSEGSRAIVFTRRSMEILQQIGVAGRISAAGLPWRFGNSFYRGQRVFRLEAPYDEDDRFQPMINLQQQYLEEYLVDRIAGQPLIDLRWGNRVKEIVRNEAYAVLRVDTPEGEYEIEGDWVVSTDGARSGMRQSLGLSMQGDAYEGRFVIADIRIDLDLPTERLAFFDPEWNPGNTVLMHREPKNIWRIDYQLPAGEAPEEALRSESLSQRIDAQLAMIGKPGVAWEMDWSSVYSARAMTLTDYVCGRIVFSGDSAHMLPIFGVRGANTGWQDCHNLAWKLAFVCKGLADERLLESYSEERVGAAREIIEEASKSTRFMAPPSHGFRLLRDATLSLSLSQEFIRPLFHWRTSRPHDYLASFLNSGEDDNTRFAGGLPDGAPIRNIRLGEDDYLFDRLGASFYLFHFMDKAPASAMIPADIVDAGAETRAAGIPLKIVAIVRNGGNDIAGADLTLVDRSGNFHAKYGAGQGASYLVRPDQHVCARWLSLDGRRLKSAIQTAIGK